MVAVRNHHFNQLPGEPVTTSQGEQAEPITIVSEDILLSLIDRDPVDTLQRLRAGRSLEGIAVALSYGKGLPDGREWGNRTERAAWLLAERARTVRKQAARIVVDEFSEAEMVATYRLAGGAGPLLRRMVREWHERHDS